MREERFADLHQFQSAYYEVRSLLSFFAQKLTPELVASEEAARKREELEAALKRFRSIEELAIESRSMDCPVSFDLLGVHAYDDARLTVARKPLEVAPREGKAAEEEGGIAM